MKHPITPSTIYSWNRLVLHNLEGKEDIKTSQAAAQTTPEAGGFLVVCLCSVFGLGGDFLFCFFKSDLIKKKKKLRKRGVLPLI